MDKTGFVVGQHRKKNYFLVIQQRKRGNKIQRSASIEVTLVWLKPPKFSCSKDRLVLLKPLIYKKLNFFFGQSVPKNCWIWDTLVFPKWTRKNDQPRFGLKIPTPEKRIQDTFCFSLIYAKTVFFSCCFLAFSFNNC